MPVEVNDFPSARRGRPSLYRWHEWLDGTLRKFKAGEDFTCKPSSFHHSAKLAAKKHGVEIDSMVSGDEVFVQAKPSANGASATTTLSTAAGAAGGHTTIAQ